MDLQKQKDKKLEQKRIQKHKTEAQLVQSFSFRPSIKRTNTKQRTFEEYLADKDAWKRDKQDEIEKKRVNQEANKYKECTFVPNLVSKYKKVNMRIIPGEKVEDRLLRSLEKSRDRQ